MSDDRIRALTEAQLACLRLVARGRRSKDIAIELGISHHTVDDHLRAAIRALGAASRFEAARMLEAHEAEPPPQRLMPQPPRLAVPPGTATLPLSSEARGEAVAGRVSAVVREEQVEFGLPLRRHRTQWPRLVRDRYGSSGNDLTGGQRLVWMAGGVIASVMTIFLLFAAYESLQRTIISLTAGLR